MSQKVGRGIGSCIGTYVESDPKNFNGGWKPFMQVRVLLDVRKPLVKAVPIKKPGNEWAWVQLKYERVPAFCYFYGNLGHNDKFCNSLYEISDVVKNANMDHG